MSTAATVLVRWFPICTGCWADATTGYDQFPNAMPLCSRCSRPMDHWRTERVGTFQPRDPEMDGEQLAALAGAIPALGAD